MIFSIRKRQLPILLFSCLNIRGASAFLGQPSRSSFFVTTLTSASHLNRTFFFHSTATRLHSKKRRQRQHQNSSPMRGVKKENLPSKICVTCGRPFTWRKKWERVWDEVTTCSKSCNRKRRESNRNNNKFSKPDGDSTIIHDEAVTNCDNEVFFDRQKLLAEGMDGNDSLRHDINADIRASSQEELLSDIKTVTANTNNRMNHGKIVSIEMASVGNGELLQGETVDSDNEVDDPVAVASKMKALRKAEKKTKKAARRAQREGRGDPTAGQKQCDMCGKSVNLLIRCMYEPNQVVWKMACGKCWHVASGGVVDGDAEHPHYRYGGLWKNRRVQS